MKILVTANQKGGVGKSTLTAHLAYAAHEDGKRVLMVDMDRQGSLSMTFPSTGGHGIVASQLYLPALPADAAIDVPFFFKKFRAFCNPAFGNGVAKEDHSFFVFFWRHERLVCFGIPFQPTEVLRFGSCICPKGHRFLVAGGAGEKDK